MSQIPPEDFSKLMPLAIRAYGGKGLKNNRFYGFYLT